MKDLIGLVKKLGMRDGRDYIQDMLDEAAIDRDMFGTFLRRRHGMNEQELEILLTSYNKLGKLINELEVSEFVKDHELKFVVEDDDGSDRCTYNSSKWSFLEEPMPSDNMMMTIDCKKLSMLALSVLTESRDIKDVVIELCSVKGTGQPLIVIYSPNDKGEAPYEMYDYIAPVKFEGKSVDEVIDYFS